VKVFCLMVDSAMMCLMLHRIQHRVIGGCQTAWNALCLLFAAPALVAPVINGNSYKMLYICTCPIRLWRAIDNISGYLKMGASARYVGVLLPVFTRDQFLLYQKYIGWVIA
jgi:hypothetical protein